MDPESDLTLEELVAAAREAGIDPLAVRRAATLTAARADPVQRLLVGAPVTPIVRASVPGRLRPEQADAMRAALDRILGRVGVVETDRGGLVWSEEHGFGRTEVAARPVARPDSPPNGDEFEVSATAERKGYLLALMLGLATVVALLLQPLGGFGGLADLAGSLGAVAAPVGAVIAGTRVLWPVLQRPTMERLEAAVLEVGALAETSSTGDDA